MSKSASPEGDELLTTAHVWQGCPDHLAGEALEKRLACLTTSCSPNPRSSVWLIPSEVITAHHVVMALQFRIQVVAEGRAA